MLGDRSNLTSRLIIVMALACAVFGASVGYLFFKSQLGLVTDEEPVAGGLVGVIHIDGTITSTEGANVITEALNQAISNSSLEAIVIRIDSPGGYAHLVEQIYLDILELKQRKPVVSSVVMALSGGLYVAVGADYIYAHPASMVGSVGVIGTAPPILQPFSLQN